MIVIEYNNAFLKTEILNMKNVDMAVRIAKTVAVTAGICSSDVDDEFDSRSFTDGFAGKMKKKVGEWVDGIHDCQRCPCSLHLFPRQVFRGVYRWELCRHVQH